MATLKGCTTALLAFWQRWSSQLMLIFSLLSIVWGIISGIMLTRDYAQSTRLIGYMALFVVASALFRLWLEYARRAQARAELENAAQEGRLVTFMLGRPALVEGAAFFATQVAVQYIVMFCLPLLFFAKAWVSLSCAAAITVASLVDPWWTYLAKRPLYMAGVRCFIALMATSFSFAVFFPTWLGFFYPCLAVVAFLSALPWGLLVEHRRHKLGDWLPGAVVLGLVLGASLLERDLRVPLLSVWLKEPGFGVSVEDHQLVEPWGQAEPRAKLVLAVAQDEEVCCYTPVVSPSGVDVPVTHEWAMDGKIIDRIQLPPIRGVGKAKGQAFRTYSCKHHLPGAETVRALSCRVFLDGDIYLGRAVTTFE